MSLMQSSPPAEHEGPRPRPRARRELHNIPDTRQRRRRWVTYGLFMGSCALMVNALIGENGYLATLRARQEQAALIAALTKVRLENQQLREEARRLREEPAAAMEEAARRELGLLKPGETLVIIRDARPATPGQVPR
jgi:cell division protein FtsB